MQTDNLKGALLIILAMCLFVVNDAFVKALSGHLAWHQATLARSLFAFVFLIAVAWTTQGAPRPRAVLGLLRYPVVALRVLFEVLAMSAWVLALMNMPLSGAIAVNQLMPVFLMIGGVLVFRERPGPHRLSAAALSILGVLMVVKPGSESFTFYALLAALATAFMAARDVAGRALPPHLSASHLGMLGLLALIAFAALASLGSAWPPLTLYIIACAAGSGVALSTALICVVHGVRMGEVSFLAPFRYAALVFGMILAYLAFGERPDPLALGGAALIILAGLYLLHRERRAKAIT